MFAMLRTTCTLFGLFAASVAAAGELKGDYLETRTCDVYTGPCFANGQGGLTGNDAIMAWSIDRGSYEGVNLAGLKVVVVTNASDTLGFGGTIVSYPDPIKSVIIVDRKATPEQHEALVQFASVNARHAGEVVKVITAPIEMSLDHFAAVGKLQAGKYARIETRKLHQGDCVCSNEENFYPPLNEVKNAVSAYTVAGGYNGPGLGTRWSNDMSRSAYLASFSY
ncbi:MAG: DUF1326 domain-containing protein [Pirellulales bacterium]